MKKTVAAQRLKLGADGMFVLPEGEYYSASDYDKLLAKLHRVVKAGNKLAKKVSDESASHLLDMEPDHSSPSSDKELANWEKAKKD